MRSRMRATAVMIEMRSQRGRVKKVWSERREKGEELEERESEEVRESGEETGGPASDGATAGGVVSRISGSAYLTSKMLTALPPKPLRP